jgi:hypothetical protein
MGDDVDRRRSSDRGDRRRKDGKKKRAFWGGVKFLLGGPISSVGVDSIAENASVIGGLAQRIKAGPNGDARVRIYDDRTLDLEAMAYNTGTSVADVRALLANRPRQNRRAVFCYVAGAIGFFGLWIWQASTTAAYTRLPYVIVLLLICGLFCLSAFYNTLVNWQCPHGADGHLARISEYRRELVAVMSEHTETNLPPRSDNAAGEGFARQLAAMKRRVAKRKAASTARPDFEWILEPVEPGAAEEWLMSASPPGYYTLALKMKEDFLATQGPDVPRISWSVYRIKSNWRAIVMGGQAPTWQAVQARAEAIWRTAANIKANS